MRVAGAERAEQPKQRERKRRERERESGREEETVSAHREGEKSSGDDEIGGAVERANRSLFHHTSNTAKELYLHWRNRGGRRKGRTEGG